MTMSGMVGQRCAGEFAISTRFAECQVLFRFHRRSRSGYTGFHWRKATLRALLEAMDV